MRASLLLLAPAIGALSLLGCDPPVKEDNIPVVEVLAPRSLAVRVNDDAIDYVGYAGAPLTFRVVPDDVLTDTDTPTTVFVMSAFLDDTPEDSALVATDDAGLRPVGVTLDVLEGTEGVLVTSEPMATGVQVYELHIDSGEPNNSGLRRLRFGFETREAAAPTICWGPFGNPVCSANGNRPDATDDVRGNLADPGRGDEYFEWFFRLVGSDSTLAAGQNAFAGTLFGDPSLAGQNVEYCVDRWVTRNPGEFLPGEVPPDITTCTSFQYL